MRVGSLLVAVLCLATKLTLAASPMVELGRPGVWPGVSGLIVFHGRVWLVNSHPFENTNAADIYSYTPAGGSAASGFRFERRLFSQDAGVPAIIEGQLFWPFEDPRFSAGRGEFSVTDGSHWRWEAIPAGRAFHVHSMIECNAQVLAGSGAYVGSIQRRASGSAQWRNVYEYPPASERISRVIELVEFKGRCLAALRAIDQPGAKLLEVTQDVVVPVAGMPAMDILSQLTVSEGWLYGLARISEDVRLVRFDGARWEFPPAPPTADLRALASDKGVLFAVSGKNGRGALWSRRTSGGWHKEQEIAGGTPISVLAHGGQIFVGTFDASGGGSLWGPSQGRIETMADPPRSLSPPRRAAAGKETVSRLMDELHRALPDPSSYQAHAQGLRRILERIAATGSTDAGLALSRRLTGPMPEGTTRTFTRVPIATADMAQWFMLRTLALLGNGRVPVQILRRPWDRPANPAQKYFHPLPAAIWAASIMGQDDHETLAALVDVLASDTNPLWLQGDAIGALTALTGKPFGYDREQWMRWGRALRFDLVSIPTGEFTMGDAQGEPDEAPSRQWVPAFKLMRHEVSNAQFRAFVSASRHVTDAQRSGSGYVWSGHWERISGATWQQPMGPGSTIEVLDTHPVVQVSVNDAKAFCTFHGLRLPRETEWEFAARGVDDERRFPWGDLTPDTSQGRRFANFGTASCCALDDSDGYQRTAPVDSFPLGASPFGILNMAGNVWEWTSTPFVNRPQWTALRGGGFGNNPYCLRVSYRHGNPEDIGLDMVGFRCAADAAP